MPSQRTNPNRQAESQVIKQRRADQLSQITKVEAIFKNDIKDIRELQKRIVVLDSVSLGLYEEIDKLSKKAPADSVTDLGLEQVNDVIRETKELLEEDAFIQRLKEFVPAGDNPEHRDVVMVLRLIREGLQRRSKQVPSKIERLDKQIREARMLKVVLEMFLSGNKSIVWADFDSYNFIKQDEWFLSSYPREFDFNRLDDIDIPEHFELTISE